jgi:hypothetical protein
MFSLNKFFTKMAMIALMIEAVSSSETSVNINQTARCNIPKDSHLHTRRRETSQIISAQTRS